MAGKDNITLISIIVIVGVLIVLNSNNDGFFGSVISNEPSSLQSYNNYFDSNGYVCEIRDNLLTCIKTIEGSTSSFLITSINSCDSNINSFPSVTTRHNINIYEPIGDFDYAFCSDNDGFVIQYFGSNFFVVFDDYYNSFYSQIQDEGNDNNDMETSSSFIKWLGEHPFPTDGGGTGRMWISGMVFVNFGFWLILVFFILKLLFGKK